MPHHHRLQLTATTATTRQRTLRRLLVVATALVTISGAALAQDPQPDAVPGWTPVPFRVRDLTFPTVLVMGFMPRPALTLPRGTWAVESSFSASNSFQVSAGIESYLGARGGPRRPLDQADVDTMLQQLDGDQFYIDGEFNLLNLVVHYGLDDRWAASLRLSHLSFGGGFLDSTIYGFHDTFNLSQAGRQYVADHQFQLLIKDDGEPFVLLRRPTGAASPIRCWACPIPFPQGRADGGLVSRPGSRSRWPRRACCCHRAATTSACSSPRNGSGKSGR